MKSPRNNNTSLARTWYDMVKPPPPGTNILYFEKHLAERILSAMRIRQSSMVLYVFSCERPEEMSWFATKPLQGVDDELWFPVDRQRRAAGGPEDDESSSCLIPTGKYGGFLLHKRFQPLLSWIHSQGLGFYLTSQKALVCYWHPGTGEGEKEKQQQERVLYNHYRQRLTRECDAQYLEDMRARIKRAMDAGQAMASVQILYAGTGFSQKTPETITEICLICHETKQVLTNATLEQEHLQWVVSDRYKPLVEALDKDGLRWSLRFQDQGQYDWALMVATWV
jgi:hypothetical protein